MNPTLHTFRPLFFRLLSLATALLLATLSPARAQGPGSLDSGTGFFGFDVFSLALQPDGKILCAGHFSAYNGMMRNGLVRLNADGSLDTAYVADVSDNNTSTGSQVNGVPRNSLARLDPDGKIVIGGSCSNVENVPRPHLARLTSDGRLDPTFAPAIGGDGAAIFDVALQPDGKVLATDSFSTASTPLHDGVERLNVGEPGAVGTLAAGWGTWPTR